MKHKSLTTLLLEYLREGRDMIFSPSNRLMVLVWIICAGGVFILGRQTMQKTAYFIGIAESRESVINFDFPVQVQRIHVISGQPVGKGELLAEVSQPDLELQIQTARANLEKLMAEQNLRREMTRIATAPPATKAKKGKKRLAAKDEFSDSKLDPMETEIRNLRQELKVLESRERKLYVFSELSGIVGTVSFKKGEMVQPYAPLLTVSSVAPSSVQGFVHESLQSIVQLDQKVRIISLADPSKLAEGRVVSVGSRIVELPLRLVPSPTLKIYGKEVGIQLPPQNPFLLGEKVSIQPMGSLLSLPIANADPKTAQPAQGPEQASGKPTPVPQAVQVPDALRAKTSFEPSGAIYLSDLKKYLVISDDTDQDHSPFLFLMNADGSVDANPIRIEGLSSIQDIESITQDEKGTIYLLSSQSLSPKGKYKSQRSLLVQIKRQGLRLTVVKTLELRPLLVAALASSKNPELANIGRGMKSDIDIESSFIFQGRYHIALKTPSDTNGKAIVLNLGSPSTLMASRKIDQKAISIAFKMDFPVDGQRQTRVTDIIKVGRGLVISTVSRHPGRVGRIWTYDPVAKRAKMLHEFVSRTPEGLAYDSDKKALMILFDEGTDPALFARSAPFTIE